MDLIDRIVKNIEEKRKQQGLSVDQLGKKSNISFSTITKIRLKEVKDVRVSTLIALAQALQCTLDDLVK